MVNSDLRNDLVVATVIIGVAATSAVFMYVFMNSILDMSKHAEKEMNRIGIDLVGNISNLDKHESTSSTKLIDSINYYHASDQQSVLNITDAINEQNALLKTQNNLHSQLLSKMDTLLKLVTR